MALVALVVVVGPVLAIGSCALVVGTGLTESTRDRFVEPVLVDLDDDTIATEADFSADVESLLEWLPTLGARADADAPFQELVNAGPSINSPDNEIDPHASADGLRLYFAGEYNGELTIYSSSRPDARSEFSPRALLPNIETGNFRSTHPIVSDDERVLIYTSARDGSDDLWLAHRDSVDDDFGPSAQLPVVNTEAFEGEAALSPDGCELIFASDRADPGANGWDLYYTRVIPR